MQEFHDKVLISNSSLEFLVKGIHSMLLESKKTASPNIQPETDSDVLDLGSPPDGKRSRKRGIGAVGIKSVAAHFATAPEINMFSAFSAQVDSAVPSVPIKSVVHPPDLALPVVKRKEGHRKVNSGGAPKNLPPEIISLNQKRQSVGAKLLAAYKESHTTKPRPAFTQLRTPTVAELAEGLEYIFSPLPRNTARQLEIVIQIRAKEVRLWVQSFAHFLDLFVPSLELSANKGREATNPDKQSDLINLMATLNGAIESSSANLRALFYEASAAVLIDHVLDKFLTLTKSVRAQKEADEFIDERRDWKENH